MKRRIQIALPPGHAPICLLDLLVDRFAYHSRAEWGGLIGDRRMRVNGVVAVGDPVLAAGDRLEFIADGIPEPLVCFDVGIIHDDPDVLVVNKPANLPVHPAGRYFNHTLWAWLKTQCGLESPMLVNRLDRETSGLLLVAKTPRAEVKCRAQFARRRVVKRYVALVEGDFPELLRAEGWLVPDPESGIARRRRFESGAPDQPALDREHASTRDWGETEFRRLDRVNGVSAVEAVPHTGRLHQIRATLSSLGFPVVGDKLYGLDPAMFVRFCTDALTEEDRRRLRMNRQALHAMEMEFHHPSTRERLHFEAPLPADMAAVLRAPARGEIGESRARL